ncbi:2-dehydropantoate 2-reductase [Alisedimentitalea sp. MJ-SS2]|uniref:2-dehydropantoate 2-reductase n=1 Tax=Aliisedimentitalea sp. MJ-SS2 TaxID=3049795 RepID=UPI00290BD113|nr:2-dehydropantoate 2-reductase [Alisedimentitalea sp. MJ-SS2]MDU8929852.1 2-dehydropantoate 2-reductase [Alisedimentitalea sp. MJ-SS2]
MDQPRIVAAGAGAIGCFVGGLLAAAGRDVVLLGRDWLRDEVVARGLTCSDFDGMEVSAAPEVAVDPGVLAGADVVLVCVKSGASAEIGRLIAQHAPEGAVVVSLQNGVRNVAVLREVLGGRDVRGGMVGFNVVHRGEGRFHRSTSGEVMIGAGSGSLGQLLDVPGLEVEEVGDIEAVQRGKLILNLTNAVNALSGMGLREMLLDYGWRRVMAVQMGEALKVFKAAGLEVRVPAKAPGWMIPWILRLPTGLFQRVAAPMLTVDAGAKTSMVADLEAGRRTEVDEFQGEIVRLGAAHRVAVPVNACVLQMVEAREGEPGLSPVRPSEVLG